MHVRGPQRVHIVNKKTKKTKKNKRDAGEYSGSWRL